MGGTGVEVRWNRFQMMACREEGGREGWREGETEGGMKGYREGGKERWMEGKREGCREGRMEEGL